MELTYRFEKWLLVSVSFIVSMIVLGLATAPDHASNTPPARPAAVTEYAPDQLQRDANMTQQMSTPSANTGSQYHRNDEQLVRSQSPGYVQALEQQQAGLDRMLARARP